MKPVDDFIPRVLDNAELAAVLHEFGNHIESCVDFGSNLIKWITESKALDSHDIVLITNLRHFLEQIDACSELVKLSICEPCLVLLRAAFESLIHAAYILESDTEERGKTFLYFRFLEQIKFLDKLDASTSSGKQMLATIGKDEYLSSFQFNQPQDINAIKLDIATRINSPAYSSIDAEYKRIKQISPNKKLSWYSLFNGATSIEGLAEKTKKSGLYEIFYRHSSGFVHGNKIVYEGAGDNCIEQIRKPYNAQFVCAFSMSLSIMMFKSYVQYYCPNKNDEFLQWFLSVRAFYKMVGNGDIIKSGDTP